MMTKSKVDKDVADSDIIYRYRYIYTHMYSDMHIYIVI